MFKSKPIAWITTLTLLGVAGVAIACRLMNSSDQSPKAEAVSWAGMPAGTVRSQEPTPPIPEPAADIRLAAYENPVPIPTPIPATEVPVAVAPSVTAPMDVPPAPVAVGEEKALSLPVPSNVPQEMPPPMPAKGADLIPVAANPGTPQAGRPAVGESVTEMPTPVAPPEAPKSDDKEPEKVLPADPLVNTAPPSPDATKHAIETPFESPKTTPEQKPEPIAPAQAEPVPVANPKTPVPSKATFDPPPVAEPIRPVEVNTPAALPAESAPITPKPPEHPKYTVGGKGETLEEIAKRTLGDADRWREILDLNPDLKAELVVPVNKKLRLPLDARVEKVSEKKEEPQGGQEAEDVPPVQSGTGLRPLPVIRTRTMEKTGKGGAPMTGTFAGKLDEKRCLVLPKEVLEQMGKGETVLLTPGPDRCLWICTQASATCMLEKMEKSSLSDADVQAFRRFYFAQSVKVNMDSDGKMSVPAALAEYSGLGKDVVLIGIDDHFEMWDAARWNRYSRPKESGGKSGE